MDNKIKDLESNIVEASSSKEKVDALNNLIDGIYVSDPHRALELSNTAIELATTGQFTTGAYKEGLANSLYYRSASYINLGSFNKAIRDADAAQKLHEEINDLLGISRTFRVFAYIYRKLGDLPGALLHNLKANEFAHQSGDAIEEARVIAQRGIIFTDLGDFQKAADAFNRSLEIFEGEEERKNLSMILNNIATLQLAKRQYQEALDFADRALQIVKEIGPKVRQYYPLSTLGETYAAMGDHQTALDLFQQAHSIATEAGVRLMEMNMLLELGKIHFELEQDTQAIDYLDQALAIANESEAKTHMYKCHQALARIFTRQGDDAIASRHFEKFLSIKKEVFSQDVDIKIEGLKAIYETELARKKAETYSLKNIELEQMIAESTHELAHAYDVTFEGWVKALEMRHYDTLGHSVRVVDLTMKLASALGVVEQEERIHIRRGALLHDIGKMAIPDEILGKQGPLTEEQKEIMQKHTEYSVQMLSGIDFLELAMDIPKYHHEKWDGTGYPYGIKGEQIPLSARIFSVVDVYDALSSDRPYRKAWSKKRSLEYIQEQSGKHFDPRIVEVFLEMIRNEG